MAAVLPPNALPPVLQAHPADICLVHLDPAHQGLGVKARRRAEAPVVFADLFLTVPPAKAQVHGGGLSAADAAQPGGKGVGYGQALPLGKAQQAHPLPHLQLHAAHRAGHGLSGRFDYGYRKCFFIHNKPLVFLFDDDPPQKAVAAAAALERRPEPFVSLVPAACPAAARPAGRAGKFQVLPADQGVLQVCYIAGAVGHFVIKFRPACFDVGPDGLRVVNPPQNLQSHQAVVQGPVLGPLGKVQPQQLRHFGEPRLFPNAQAQPFLGVPLQVAVLGEKRHLAAAAEIPAVHNQSQNIGRAPGDQHPVPQPAAEPAHRPHKAQAPGEVFLGDAGQVRHHRVQPLAHLGPHKAGKDVLFLQPRPAFHRTELNDLVDISFQPPAVGRVPFQVQYGKFHRARRLLSKPPAGGGF